RDWQRGVEDTEWRPVEGLAERGGRALSGGQWRDWQRGVEDTEWRDWQRGVEDTEWRDWQRGVEGTEWRPVEGLAERGGGH
ncbi:unnamed protein product, partial [Staurois parvus]